MSGTSCDGLDICLVQITRYQDNLKIEHFLYESFYYDSTFRQGLRQAIEGNAAALCKINFRIAEQYVQYIQQFLQRHDLTINDFDLIGSHGQTIWHIDRQATLQLGESAVLAEAFGVPVVSDFRVRDVAAGGTGAPLVPMVDYLLFKDLNQTVLLLNIGGIANFTIVPRNATNPDVVLAFDTGPGNALMDRLAEIMTASQWSHDWDGKVASQGKILPQVLAELQQHPFILTPPPKSTGPEIFSKNLLADLIARYGISPAQYQDLMATLNYFTAWSIFYNYDQYCRPNFPVETVIVSGGGAHNPVLMTHLAQLFGNIPVRIANDYGIPADGKEALAFAILAALTIWDMPGNIPAVTGARHPVILGKITI